MAKRTGLIRYKDLKVKPKLIFSILLVVIIASISGVMGLILLLSTDSKYSDALIANGFSQGDIGYYNTYLNKGGAVIRDIILLTDQEQIDSANAELEDIKVKMQDALVDVKEYCTTDKELEYIAVIDENYPVYEEKRDYVIELASENKNEDALKVFTEEMEPVLDKIMAAAESLADLNQTMGVEVSAKLTTQSQITAFIVAAIIIVAILFSIFIAIVIAKGFANPIIQVQNASARLEKGDLDIKLEVDSVDEIGMMSISFEKAVGNLKLYISEITRILSEVAQGNFDVENNVKFEGDFHAIEEAIEMITSSLSDTMNQISDASGQVALGAGQMAESAQSLAEGATEQAGAIEELTATIENTSTLVTESANKANESYEQALKFEKEAEGSSEDMGALTSAMERINVTSKEIENIISEIEEIASQTNLLSLNASIEAARAGEAGRGFAVVADQIGKLAADSAKSAVNTRTLISNSIEEISKGNDITVKTTQALETVIGGIKLLAESSRETSDMCKNQAETMKQIEQGIEQISSVVQNNSASAQETSATSEELSAQSENLKALVEQFRLKG